MKLAAARFASRPYRQRARADAAATTRRRIIEAFRDFLRDRWFEDVRLEHVAAGAGVTVQTVIRRFGGKDGLLRESWDLTDFEVRARRAAAPVVPADDRAPRALRKAIAVLVDDYEHHGDMILRLLAQEGRHPTLRPVLDRGRKGHRDWLGMTFAPWLEPLSRARRERRLDALVVATDVYAWKLLRRDMRLAPAAAAAILADLVHGVLDAPAWRRSASSGRNP